MRRFWVGWVFLIAVLTACASAPPAAATPEWAVLQAVERSPAIPDAQVLPETLQVVQSQVWEESVMVLVRYSAQDQARRHECDALYQAITLPNGWAVNSSGAGCVSGQPTQPAALTASSGMHSSSDTEPFSYAYGQVNDARIASVRVTWDDGKANSAVPVRGYYLVVRSGNHPYTKIEGLDADGMVIEKIEVEIAPGKTP